MYKFINILILLLLLYNQGIGQKDSLAYVHVISKVDQGQIVLRWAPSTSIAWHLGITKGYSIERAVNKQGDSTMGEFVMIEPQRLPWPKQRWQKEQLATYDNYCIIAAELLYGKGTSVTANTKLLQRADEFQNKYTYAMMSADFSAQAADALGLSFTDKDVKPGNVYIYRIKSLASHENYIIEPATVVCYPSMNSQLIPPSLNQIKPMDRAVKLLWDREQSPSQYVAYYVEKSADGVHYNRLNDVPYLSGDNIGNDEFKQFHVYIDSVDQNYKPYYYRLVGLSPFGEESLPGEYEKSFGVDLTPPTKPEGLKSEQQGPGTVKLSWIFPKDENDAIAGFLIGRSAHVLDSFTNITTTILPPDSREFIDESANPLKPNFYFVTAIDTAGNYNISVSHYAHLIDSIPPAPPVDVSGTVDTNGVVLLKWSANSEPDILGYEVHFSNQSDHVFAALTDAPIPHNHYSDTIMIRTLTEHIYYKIVAVDRNNNYSSYSKMLELERPDVVRPAIALISDFAKTEKGVLLKWNNSSSKDVAGHSIYRTEYPERGEWVQVFTTSDKNLSVWVDENIKPMSTYYYKVHAFDEVNLLSNEGNIVKVITSAAQLDVRNLSLQSKVVDKQVHLSWKALPGVRKYIVYKKVADGKYYTLASTVSNVFIDHQLDLNSTYTLRCIDHNGVYSSFSNEANIIN